MTAALITWPPMRTTRRLSSRCRPLAAIQASHSGRTLCPSSGKKVGVCLSSRTAFLNWVIRCQTRNSWTAGGLRGSVGFVVVGGGGVAVVHVLVADEDDDIDDGDDCLRSANEGNPVVVSDSPYLKAMEPTSYQADDLGRPEHRRRRVQPYGLAHLERRLRRRFSLENSGVPPTLKQNLFGAPAVTYFAGMEGG